MTPHDQHIIHSSKCPNWRTPRALFDALHTEFSFAVDLAADADSSQVRQSLDGWPRYLGPGSPYAEDALAAHWCVYGTGFLNPPWSREAKMPIEPWVEKCVEESQRGWHGVSIFPASVQTKWWQLVRRHAYEIRLIPHRVSFELSPEDLAAWNLQRMRDGKSPKTKPDNAGGNTAVAIWKPLTGYLHPWEASVRYWSYR